MRAVETQSFPDPALTANLYCAGGLDETFFRVVAPFWRELRLQDPERLCSLWVVRYGRRGEHLKIRVHGPGSLLLGQRELLARRAGAFFASLPEPSPRHEIDRAAPAIDEEDEAGGLHPDRTLLWTLYRRSHVSLGSKPLLSDDRYVLLLTRCLAAACDRLLAEEPDPAGRLPQPARQRALLKGLITGLGALPLPPAAWNDYLAYHRDWLLRYALPRAERAELQPLEQLRRRLDEQTAGRKDSLPPLWRAAAREWERERGDPEERAEPAWRGSLVALWDFVCRSGAGPEHRPDPFAGDPAFAPLAKVFHGLANQLGLRRIDEAFTLHLLLRALQSAGADPERAVS